MTKTEFLQVEFTKNPLVEYSTILNSWTNSVNMGSISQSLFFAVRTKMGIKIVSHWGFADQEQDDSHLDHYTLNTHVPLTHYELKVSLKDTKPNIWRRSLSLTCR